MKESLQLCRLAFEQCGYDKPKVKLFMFHYVRKAVTCPNRELTLAKLIQVMEAIADKSGKSYDLKHQVSKQAFNDQFS